MQQIERYGVIALVFLLVTIVAVSFWGDNKSPGFWSRLTGKGKKEEVVKTEPPPAFPVTTSEQALTTPLPLNEMAAQPGAAEPTFATGTPGAITLPGAEGQPSAPPGGPSTFPVLDAAQSAPVTMTPGGMGRAPATVPQPAFANMLEPAVGALEYTVQKGDSLALIARRTLGSEQRWTEIQALNPGVTPKSLKLGSKLHLPSGANLAAVRADRSPLGKAPAKVAAQTSVKKAAEEPSKKGGTRYTIQRGDTLNAIAERKLGNKSRVKEILALNPGLDPRRLTVGKSIQIPSEPGSRGVAPERAPLVAQASIRSSNPDRPRVR